MQYKYGAKIVVTIQTHEIVTAECNRLQDMQSTCNQTTINSRGIQDLMARYSYLCLIPVSKIKNN